LHLIIAKVQLIFASHLCSIIYLIPVCIWYSAFYPTGDESMKHAHHHPSTTTARLTQTLVLPVTIQQS
jgi:hypothetical protein